MIDFNINNNIFVKLTDIGMEELRRQHEEFIKEFPAFACEFSPPETDKDGWSKFQMHELMTTFANMVIMGSRLPFEATVRLDIK